MKFSSLVLASVIALSTAGASLAQPAPGPAPAAPGAEGRRWERPDPAQMAERHAEKLRAILQLRPDQEPALRALVDAMKPDPAEMQRREAERGARDQARPQLTTPQRLDRMQARLAERQAQFARRADAIKRFYAQLNPAQQRAFDALPMMGGHHHGGHEGGMGGEHEHGPHGMDAGKSPGAME